MKHSDVVDKTGKVTLPQGYLWCPECDALTPHTEKKKWEDYVTCMVCSYERMLEYAGCPVCGWAPSEDEAPEAFDVVLHIPGCHCAPYDEEYEDENTISELANSYSPIWQRIYNTWSVKVGTDFFYHKEYGITQWVQRMSNGKIHQIIYQECGCPKVRVFRNLHMFDAWSRYSSNPGCWNASEWGWTIRCQVCGEVYDVDYDSC